MNPLHRSDAFRGGCRVGPARWLAAAFTLTLGLAGCQVASAQSLEPGRYSGALAGVIPLNVQVFGSTVRVNGGDVDLPDPTATRHFVTRGIGRLDLDCEPVENGSALHCHVKVTSGKLPIPCPTAQNCTAIPTTTDVDLLKICNDPTCP